MRNHLDEMITLRALTEAEFDNFSRRSISEYAENMIESHEWDRSTALANATMMFNKTLPQGLRTPTHQFFSIRPVDMEYAVGNIWIRIDIHDRSAFILDIFVEPEYRGRGYASRAIPKIEHYARKLGAATIRLHVFGPNHAAQRLYNKLGFTVSHATMVKGL
ncbi:MULTISPECIES: GNAT family N-acetyltransferase [unclassified Cupriavidus]|uniref:GNAT family N-acetyltransferase n=1 Tax=unclassified Cupriavidus TaxID=2640874 RepID=UPI00048D72A8|nr:MULTISPECIES: GNAT family N-acetyltransferase [unclassified Cupriavidus]MBP0633421.1 N-acetyltransferase [Cupriavidus sp. AcVe19-1a]MBP0639817.1 N-acetyltransferase [Cupriavidus sp. AcVe19-6a]